MDSPFDDFANVQTNHSVRTIIIKTFGGCSVVVTSIRPGGFFCNVV